MSTDNISETSSIGSDSDIDEIVLSHPMYHILNQFLRTDDGTNIATCVQELTTALKELKQLMSIIPSKKP